MQIQMSSEWIDMLIGIIGLLFMLGLLVEGIVISLKILKWIVLWATEAKDLEDLRTRLEKRKTEARARRIASGQSATLRGALRFLGRGIWTAYRHPIRAWRGEFDLPKKDVSDAGGQKP